MARPPKPWYRTERQSWFVNIGGKQVNLGPEKDEAYRQFGKLLNRPKAARTAGVTVFEIYAKYLGWCEAHRSAGTLKWYRKQVLPFIDWLAAHRELPAAPDMPSSDLRPHHVISYVDAQPTWGANQKRGATVALTHPFAWAVKTRLTDENPVRGTPRPDGCARPAKLTPEAYRALLDHLPAGDPFRDLLEFGWEAGCRPQEARQIEAGHVQLDRHRVVFPPAEAKGKTRWRTIYLSPAAEAVLSRRMRANGFVFLNSKLRPWTAYAISCRFKSLAKKVGVKYAMGDLRKLFATRKLKEGIDVITVASLLGHKDATMLFRHYQQLSLDQPHLLAAVNPAASTPTPAATAGRPPAGPSVYQAPPPAGSPPGANGRKRPGRPGRSG